MTWIQRLFDRVVGTSSPGGTPGERKLEEERDRTRQTILRTLEFGVEVRDAELEVIEHSALVSVLCGSFGRRMNLSEADLYILETAARLHETGMLAVPPALLLRPTPLSPEELEQVRGQARISAALAGLMHHPRVARLIEYQYDDYVALSDRLPESDLLLAGLFRVADVVAAVTRPRPYQDPLPRSLQARILQSGAGTRFHPLAVRCALGRATGS